MDAEILLVLHAAGELVGVLEFGLEIGDKLGLQVGVVHLFPALDALPHEDEVHLAGLVVVDPHLFVLSYAWTQRFPCCGLDSKKPIKNI